MTMKKLKIKQIKSGIARPLRQKRTLIALGIKKMHNERIVEATPQMLGMIEKVKHLLSIEEVK
jgi:large subunit ribosomal protein L30